MEQKRVQGLGRELQALIKEDEGNGENAEKRLQEDMEKDAAREQSKKTQVHWAWCMVFWVLIVIGIAVLLMCVWHCLAPQGWRWLGETEVKNLFGYLIAGGGGAFVKSIVKYI